MKKINLLLLILLGLGIQSFAQQWNPIGTGVTNTSADYKTVHCMLEFNNELYVAGCFTGINGVATSYIAKYNGTTWSPVGEGLTHTGNNSNIMYSGVICMAVFNGELYAGGIFNRSGATPLNNIAKWNGNAWVSVGPFTNFEEGILALCVYNNELYAGGRMLGPYNCIAKWNGTAWNPMGTGVHQDNGNPGLVRSMKVFNNKLYIGGQFATCNNVNSDNLIAWNGTSFSSIGTGAEGNYGVATMNIFNNELVIGGGITNVNGVPYKNIAKFNGTTWSGLGSGVGVPSGNSFELQCLFPFNNKLVASGYFTNAGSLSVSGIAAWNGTTWETMGNQGFEGVACSLSTYKDTLFAGGPFTVADGTPAMNLAKWSEPAAVSTPIKSVDNNSNDIKIYPNPTSGRIFLSGYFNAKVIDLTGKVVLEKEDTNSLDISNCNTGMYFIFLRDEKGMALKCIKVTKE